MVEYMNELKVKENKRDILYSWWIDLIQVLIYALYVSVCICSIDKSTFEGKGHVWWVSSYKYRLLHKRSGSLCATAFFQTVNMVGIMFIDRRGFQLAVVWSIADLGDMCSLGGLNCTSLYETERSPQGPSWPFTCSEEFILLVFLFQMAFNPRVKSFWLAQTPLIVASLTASSE